MPRTPIPRWLGLPEYFTHAEATESADRPYPGGYLFVLVMTRLEGTVVGVSGKERPAPFVLSADDMRIIIESTINAHGYVAACLPLEPSIEDCAYVGVLQILSPEGLGR